MADDIEGVLPDGREVTAAPWDDDRGDRWPVPSSVALVIGSSAVLWALIIAGVRWLIA